MNSNTIDSLYDKVQVNKREEKNLQNKDEVLWQIFSKSNQNCASWKNQKRKTKVDCQKDNHLNKDGMSR